MSQVDYLGHVISAKGLAPNQEKIAAILDWPIPRSLTALRGFLGLTGFYRRFVRNYCAIAAPLTNLLKVTKFTWTIEANTSFTNLKQSMTTTPVLALPDFTKSFSLETDAFAFAIGAVLSQEGHPLAFFSRKMCPRMQQSSVYVRELFAITEAVKKWREYLIGRHFHIYTDQKSLKELLVQTIQTPEQQKRAAKLQGFSFDIHYKLGKTNLVVDALSRKHSEDEDDDSLLLSVSSSVPGILQDMRKFYKQNEQGQKLVTGSLSTNNYIQYYSFKEGFLFFKDRIFIPDLHDWRPAIISEFHNSPSAGHSGSKPTYSRMAASFL